MIPNEVGICDVLENMRYKYLSMKHDNLPKTEEIVEDLIEDMITISWALRTLINPFYEFKRIDNK